MAAAVDLFTVQPPEIVTVADIASRAGMTSAAFYYHFASKEELLEELVRTFAERWVEAVTTRIAEVTDVRQLGNFVDAVLDWAEANQAAALVFFTSAAGATAGVDRCRADTRNRIVEVATETIGRVAPSPAPATAEASAVALFVLIYIAVRSRLTVDEVFQTLGHNRFRREVRRLTLSIVGPQPRADAHLEDRTA
jgi:AcrR family transcriptional regulator